MSLQLRKALLAALGAAVVVAPFSAEATNGYFAHGYGTKAKGMAGAGVAFSDDSIAAATNPANMVLVGGRWDIGAEIFIPDRTAQAIGGATYDGNGSGFGEQWFLIPEFGYNKMINKNMSFGVSVFGNGGMNTSYTTPIFGTTNAGVDLMQLFVSPTISLKLDDNNTIGASVNLVYQRFKITGIQGFTGLSTDPTAVTDRGYDNSFGAGFRIGWNGKLTNNLSAGFTFQPKTNMEPFSKYKGLFAEAGDFDIPANYALGIAWKATPQMMVLFDVEKIKYSQVKAIANPNPSGALGASNGTGFGWTDMDIYKLGINYQYSKDLVLRAGWNHGQQPIPASQTTFNVLAPATVEDHLTLGFTMNMKNGAELSGFYMHAFEKTVNGNGTASGGYNLGMSQNSVGIAYGAKF